MNFSEHQWDELKVLRKTREQMQRQSHLKKQALREGNFVSQKKQAGNAQSNLI